MDFQTKLIEQLKAMVATKYGGDWAAAFRHYDTDGDGKVARLEMYTLLYDLGVGGSRMRQFVVGAILEACDEDKDGKVSFAELEQLIKGE